VRIALAEGADRVELCAGLEVGGLTPSAGLIELAVETARDAGVHDFVHVLVRPRPGGFYYDGVEIDVVLRDIRQARELGAAGVVVGVLDDADLVDIDTTRALVDAAGPLCVTFHRAIDVVPKPADAVAELAEVGVRRILSSGQAAHSTDGIETLAAMVDRAAGRVQIVAGGNVRSADIASLAAAGVSAVHLSARRTVEGTASGPGGGHARYEVTDATLVRQAVDAAARLDAG